jgi:hypothetical protein
MRGGLAHWSDIPCSTTSYFDLFQADSYFSNVLPLQQRVDIHLYNVCPALAHQHEDRQILDVKKIEGFVPNDISPFTEFCEFFRQF